MMAELNAKMDGNQVEMRSTICALLSELKETIQREMKAVMQPVRAEMDETTACREATETEPNPGMMQFVEEHQEIPKGEGAVMPVGEPRKRRRVKNLAAERRQKGKKRTRGNRGSRRKSAAACRKVFRRPKVAWRKRTGKFESRQVVNGGNNFPSHAGRCPAVKKWQGARGTDP
jgi:hypothetical protein